MGDGGQTVKRGMTVDSLIRSQWAQQPLPVGVTQWVSQPPWRNSVAATASCATCGSALASRWRSMSNGLLAIG